MNDLSKKQEFKKKVKNMFLSEKVKQSDIGPTRSKVFELLAEYNFYLLEHEKVQSKEGMVFLTKYIRYCKHCARPVDWILVESILEGFLEI